MLEPWTEEKEERQLYAVRFLGPLYDELHRYQTIVRSNNSVEMSPDVRILKRFFCANAFIFINKHTIDKEEFVTNLWIGIDDTERDIVRFTSKTLIQACTDVH